MTKEEAIRILSTRDKYGVPCGYTSGYQEALDMAIEALKERPTGEWIDAEIPLESGGAMPIQVCNLCSTFFPLAHTGGGYRFCPNCGARMSEREV